MTIAQPKNLRIGESGGRLYARAGNVTQLVSQDTGSHAAPHNLKQNAHQDNPNDDV